MNEAEKGGKGDRRKHDKIISFDESRFEGQLKRMERENEVEALVERLEAEGEAQCEVGRSRKIDNRDEVQKPLYNSELDVYSGKKNSKVPRLKSMPLENQIIERLRRRESSVEEVLMELYLAGISMRRVENITEAIWGARVGPSEVSELNKKLFNRIDKWRTRPLQGSYAYVYLNEISLKVTKGEQIEKVSIFVAIGVNQEGYREVLGIQEETKEEDRSGWHIFLRSLKRRGLSGLRLIVSDKHSGLVESVAEIYPDACWQWCKVRFYQNASEEVPDTKINKVSAMLKAIHSQEDHEAAISKTRDVVKKLNDLKLPKAAELVEKSIHETLSYMNFPRKHWRSLASNNSLERLIRETKKRTRLVGSFPDGESALMLTAARLRHFLKTEWGKRRYQDMDRLRKMDQSQNQTESHYTREIELN